MLSFFYKILEETFIFFESLLVDRIIKPHVLLIQWRLLNLCLDFNIIIT